jgi:hypothetical protein
MTREIVAARSTAHPQSRYACRYIIDDSHSISYIIADKDLWS